MVKAITFLYKDNTYTWTVSLDIELQTETVTAVAGRRVCQFAFMSITFNRLAFMLLKGVKDTV